MVAAPETGPAEQPRRPARGMPVEREAVLQHPMKAVAVAADPQPVPTLSILSGERAAQERPIPQPSGLISGWAEWLPEAAVAV